MLRRVAVRLFGCGIRAFVVWVWRRWAHLSHSLLPVHEMICGTER
jgi:hypothetical protein